MMRGTMGFLSRLRGKDRPAPKPIARRTRPAPRQESQKPPRPAAPEGRAPEVISIGRDRTGREWGVAKKSIRHSIVVGEPDSGKSCDYETRVVVFDSEEQKMIWEPIGEFVHGRLGVPFKRGSLPLPRRFFVPSLDPEGKVEWKPVTDVYVHRSPERLVQISMKNGRVLNVTADHSVLALKDGMIAPVRGDGVHEGDVLFAPSLVVPPSTEGPPRTGGFELTPDFAKLLGYYVSEGNAHRTRHRLQPRTLRSIAKNLLRAYSMADIKRAEVLLERLKTLARSEVVPEEIKSVEEVSAKHPFVYDFAVEDNENFLAEGVFVHNTTYMKHLVLQHIRDRESVVIMEPHYDLIKSVLTHIPPDRWEDVVYINPLNGIEDRRVVQVNFLRWSKRADKSLAINSFIDALSKHYMTFWGPRLEKILRHALDLLWDTVANPSLLDLHDVLTNKKDRRDRLLARSRDSEQHQFWDYTYKDMPPDAHIAVLTKLAQLVSDHYAKPFTSADQSSVDFRELMDTGKIVLIDLQEGNISQPVVNMLGSLFLSVIYQAGMSRVDTPERERVPAHVFIDEAHRFVTTSLPDSLESLRKYRVYFTLATQNSDQFETPRDARAPMGDVILPLCSTKVVFRCSENDARRMEPSFSSRGWKFSELMNLPKYKFAVSTLIGRVTRCAVFETVNDGDGETNPRDVIAHSIEQYGKDYDPTQFEKEVDVPAPLLSPIEHFAVIRLYGGERLTRHELVRALHTLYGFRDSLSEQAIQRLRDAKYIGYSTEPGGAGRYFQLTPKGRDYLYPFILGGRSGGPVHGRLLIKTLKRLWELGLCPVVCSGGKEVEVNVDYYDDSGSKIARRRVMKAWSYPDAVVWRGKPYRVRHAGKVYEGTDARKWNESGQFALEIEVYPSHHLDRVLGHYHHAREADMGVLFVVPDEHEAKAIRDHLTAHARPKFVPNIADDPYPENVEIRVETPDIPPDDRDMNQWVRKHDETIAEAAGEIPEDPEPVEPPEELEEPPEAGGSRAGKPGVIPKGTRVFKPPEEAAKEWTEEKRQRLERGTWRTRKQNLMEIKKKSEWKRTLEDRQRYARERGDTDEVERLAAEIKRADERLAVLRGEKLPPGSPAAEVMTKKEAPREPPAEPGAEYTTKEKKTAPADPRREKIVRARDEGLTFWTEEIRNHMHLYAGKVTDGRLEKGTKVYIGFFDDECERLLAELGVDPKSVLDSPPEPKEEASPETSKKKVSVRPKGLPKSVKNLNTIRSQVRRYDREGYRFKVRGDNRLYAVRWNKEKKKKELHYITTWDDRVKALLKRMRISVD